MAAEFSWIVQGRVLYGWMSGKLSLDQIVLASETVAKHLDEAEAPLVHLLYHMEELSPSGNLKELREGSRPVMEHPRLGWMVVYGIDSKFMEFMLSTLMKMFRNRIRFVSSYQEGIDFLQDVDATLPELPAKAPSAIHTS